MRAAPALQVTVQRFGVWRFAVASLCGATAAGLVHWLQAGFPWVAGAAALAAFAGWRGALNAPQRLAWDGTQWSDADGPIEPPRVMFDLGGFVLLRHARDGRAHWLPLQRRGLEAHWHALRCALYSPRPASASAPPDDAPPPA